MRRCVNCQKLFQRRPQNKDQCYCGEKPCQRARKSNWQRQKLTDDPEYRKNQKASQKAWQETHQDYWEKYRQKNPEQAERNRKLQLIRNAKKRGHFVESVSMNERSQPFPFRLDSFSMPTLPIAKMDASTPCQLCLIAFSDQDLIAKMDASNPLSAQVFKAFVQLPVIAKMDA